MAKPIIGPANGYSKGQEDLESFLMIPFVVRANRETTAGELLLTWDQPRYLDVEWDTNVLKSAKLDLSVPDLFSPSPTRLDGRY